MECAAAKPSKPSSNISEMVSKFAKVCKLRSIGVFSNENPNHHHDPINNNNGPSMGKDSSDATEETERNAEKIHPHPDVAPSKSHICGDQDISEIFDIVTALKLAYVRLQEAHVPYDPDKIIAGDEHFMVQLRALCKIKRTYKEKQLTKAKLDSSRLDCLHAEVEVNEKALEKLKAQNRAKDAEIVRLQRELDDLNLGNALLAEKMKQKNLEKMNVKVLNIATFEEIYKAALKSIHNFAKPLISLMKASGWDLDLAAKSIVNEVVYSKRSHKKYAFETYIARRMVHGISLKSCSVDDVMRFDDPIDSLIENHNSEFSNFCRKKYLFVVHPIMEMSFFGNLDQRMFVLSGKHPRTPFYQIFATMAKWVWMLQGIATSIDPNAEIFAVYSGSKFSDVYMESVEECQEGAVVFDGGQSNRRVEFMVMPGFRIGEKLVRSQVYLSEQKPSPGTC